jgi:hypothetical protein
MSALIRIIKLYQTSALIIKLYLSLFLKALAAGGGVFKSLAGVLLPAEVCQFKSNPPGPTAAAAKIRMHLVLLVTVTVLEPPTGKSAAIICLAGKVTRETCQEWKEKLSQVGL